MLIIYFLLINLNLKTDTILTGIVQEVTEIQTSFENIFYY
jgi:hypothetical protein